MKTAEFEELKQLLVDKGDIVNQLENEKKEASKKLFLQGGGGRA